MKTTFFSHQQTTMRFVIIGVIVLAMLIPLAMVEGVTKERQSFFDLTLSDIANAWGNAQNVAGPFLIVPEVHRTPVENEQGELVWHEIERERVYLPEALEIEADVAHQYRRRAIYEVPVYSADIRLRGSFPSLDSDVFNRSDVTVLPERARIVMGISHTQAISTASPLNTEDSAFEFRPGTGAPWIGSGIHASIEGHQGGATQFDFVLALKGTRQLGFTPVGGSTRVNMTSTWPHPSFKGTYLPERFEVGDQGFSAEWVVHELARALPDSWLTGAVEVQLSESFAWISLFQPVTEYTIVDRAIKYGLLFISLTFLGFLCFELRTALRFHPVQYGVVGMGLVLFYLALLSLSEHLAFGLSLSDCDRSVDGADRLVCVGDDGRRWSQRLDGRDRGRSLQHALRIAAARSLRAAGRNGCAVHRARRADGCHPNAHRT